MPFFNGIYSILREEILTRALQSPTHQEGYFLLYPYAQAAQ